MWKGESVLPGHRGLKWALLLTLLIVLGVIVDGLNSANGAEVEVGENICFPAHWCIPGTAGETAINLAPTSDTPPMTERIAPRK